MVIKPLFIALCILCSTYTTFGADTLQYWVSKSDLVDGTGIRSHDYQVAIVQENASHFRAFLFMSKPDSLEGSHWDTFFAGLKTVPFYFEREDGKLGSLRLNETYKALDGLMLSLAAGPFQYDPDAYSAINRWLNGLKPRHELPASLQNAFTFLPDLFTRPIVEAGRLSIPDSVKTCNSKTVPLYYSHHGVRSQRGDTLIAEKDLSLQSDTCLYIFRELAACGMLDGLEVDVIVDRYEWRQNESWTWNEQQGLLSNCSRRKTIRMTFGDYTTTRETRFFVVRLQ